MAAPASGCSPHSSSSVKSLPPPCPKSPPDYPDLYGKRRELAKVQMLEREINFLEVEHLPLLSFSVLCFGLDAPPFESKFTVKPFTFPLVMKRERRAKICTKSTPSIPMLQRSKRFCGREPGPADTHQKPKEQKVLPILEMAMVLLSLGYPVSTSHGFAAAAAPVSLAVVQNCHAATSPIPALAHLVAVPAAAATAVVTAAAASLRRPTTGPAAASPPPPLPVAVVFPASIAASAETVERSAAVAVAEAARRTTPAAVLI
ncbi:unnamed protein product [Linum tenue]|uniref:Uncharacterized protein n=1 Tax=Linum tenue TaxID=586396 RepID=A0AAV0S3R2_9ROSI|nr:unnamed protein product [Linum tenue]